MPVFSLCEKVKKSLKVMTFAAVDDGSSRSQFIVMKSMGIHIQYTLTVMTKTSGFKKYSLELYRIELFYWLFVL